jgi:hypothetical protein
MSAENPFRGFTPQGCEQLAEILRRVLKRQKCACGEGCKPNTGCRSPGPIQDVPFKEKR